MLLNTPLFNQLPESYLEELEGRALQSKYAKNHRVIMQGNRDTSMYVVLSGRLKVHSVSEEGKQTILAFLNTGDFFGELALFDQQPRSASVTTVEPSRLLQLSQKNLIDFLHQYPDANISIFRALTQRIRDTDAIVCNLSQKDVYGRLRNILLQQSTQQGQHKMTPKITHQELANMAGSSREMITRILKELRIGGYINIKSKQIILCKKLPLRW